MNKNIHLTKEEKDIVISILSNYLSAGTEVFLFGSRTKPKPSNKSDLDILIKGEKTIDLGLLALIKDEFEKSDLVFKVDLLDCNSLPKTMLQNISKNMVKII